MKPIILGVICVTSRRTTGRAGVPRNGTNISMCTRSWLKGFFGGVRFLRKTGKLSLNLPACSREKRNISYMCMGYIGVVFPQSVLRTSIRKP